LMTPKELIPPLSALLSCVKNKGFCGRKRTSPFVLPSVFRWNVMLSMWRERKALAIAWRWRRFPNFRGGRGGGDRHGLDAGDLVESKHLIGCGESERSIAG
jgi:hypothetical protein